MVQKYQNEIAPIFYYGISTKINKKDIKMSVPAWYQTVGVGGTEERILNNIGKFW